MIEPGKAYACTRDFRTPTIDQRWIDLAEGTLGLVVSVSDHPPTARIAFFHPAGEVDFKRDTWLLRSVEKEPARDYTADAEF